MQVRPNDYTFDLIATKKQPSPKGPWKENLWGFLKSKGRVRSEPGSPRSELLSLALEDFRFLNFNDIICPGKVFKHLLAPSRETDCGCLPDQFEIEKKFGYLLQGRCLRCDFVDNRKLLVSLFVRTGTQANCRESVRKVKMLTDCTLFVGGFTGKENSSYFLIGNSSHKNFSETFRIQKTFRRKRSQDINGFELLEDARAQQGFEALGPAPGEESFCELEREPCGSPRRSSFVCIDGACDEEKPFARRKSSFVSVRASGTQLKQEYFKTKRKTKFFFLDPHYIQVG